MKIEDFMFWDIMMAQAMIQKNMHGAEARGRFSEWCSETWKSNAPQSLFFARKIEDLVLPGIMIAHVII